MVKYGDDPYHFIYTSIKKLSQVALPLKRHAHRAMFTLRVPVTEKEPTLSNQNTECAKKYRSALKTGL